MNLWPLLTTSMTLFHNLSTSKVKTTLKFLRLWIKTCSNHVLNILPLCRLILWILFKKLGEIRGQIVAHEIRGRRGRQGCRLWHCHCCWCCRGRCRCCGGCCATTFQPHHGLQDSLNLNSTVHFFKPISLFRVFQQGKILQEEKQTKFFFFINVCRVNIGVVLKRANIFFKNSLTCIYVHTWYLHYF